MNKFIGLNRARSPGGTCFNMMRLEEISSTIDYGEISAMCKDREINYNTNSNPFLLFNQCKGGCILFYRFTEI